MRARSAARGAAMLAALLVAACAPGRLQLPSGDGEPFPAFAEAAAEATASCRGVRTLTAELGISGRAGSQKLRGRATAGIQAPSSLRIEGTAPFGPPVFILAADQAGATLLLPRDNRVLAGQRPAAILEALVGLDLDPADLLALLSGCVVPDPQPTGGRLLAGGWARIDLPGGDLLFLRKDGRQKWQIRAGTRAHLQAEYDRNAQGAPAAVRIASRGADPGPADLRLALSQVDLNVTLAPDVFRVKVPADAAPISLAELREGGPMGDRR